MRPLSHAPHPLEYLRGKRVKPKDWALADGHMSRTLRGKTGVIVGLPKTREGCVIVVWDGATSRLTYLRTALEILND